MNRVKPLLQFTALCLAMATLQSCVTSHVIVGKIRPPITPDQVQLYSHAPAKYEEIAMIDTSSRNSWSFTDQGKMNSVILRLKTDAAKLGANGILLQSVGDKPAGSIGTGTFSASGGGNSVLGVGLGTNATMYVKAGSAMAIYVAPENAVAPEANSPAAH